VEGSIENVRGVAEGAAETAVTHKNYAIGTYTGTGQYQTISLGFRPSMLIISEYYAVTDDASEAQGKISVFVDALNGGKLNLQSDGVLLYADESRVYPRVNESGYKYRYIAFR
jgi:TRAP-type uncharacterized transport system substrate-binding protein